MLDTLSLHPHENGLRRQVLETLEPSRRHGPCLSIYLPRQSASLSPAHRKFRFARMVRQAERLVVRDHGVAAARELVAELWRANPLRLIDQSGLALAFFHEREFTGAIHLPVDAPERVVVADSFHVKPVLAWLQCSPPFYLVSLSAKRIRLYEGSPWELRLLSLIERGGGRDDAGEESGRREDLRQFFLRAERELRPILGADRSPVVIAGVSRLHPLYRQVNRDPDLIARAIHGNVERWSEERLREAALEAIGGLLEQVKRDVAREFLDLSRLGRATDDLARIARAAARGQVRKILVASDQVIFGRFDARTGALAIHGEQLDASDDDVLDDLAETVLARGGKVLCVPTRDLPTRSPAAAVLAG